MADKAKHAYGSRKNLDAAIASGKIDAFDVLFLQGEGEAPAMGWVDKDGNPVIIEQTDISGVEKELANKANSEDVENLEIQLASKANVEEVDEKIGKASQSSVDAAKAYTDKMVDAAMGEHLTKKYEIADVPAGSLVDYRESEIRIFCPESVVWNKQSVGVGGDANCYYATFKCYVPNDDVVGYIEHLNDKVDSEVLTDLSKDEYGRKYQPTWLALARYNEETDAWTYYGKNSTSEKFVGWNYQIDWYNADGIVIASDCVRINLSNESCHTSIEPYYVGGMKKEIEEKIAEMETKIE